MQIKKGPFGYFALEKFDKPDRISSYAEEVIAGNKSDFYLTPSTEYIGSSAMCCFEFSGYVQITDPEFSVFPSQRKFSSHKKETRLLNLRRKSVGDLFYSFVKFLDNLISPSCIVMDPDMVFTDTEGIAIKFCCLPVMSDPEDLCLASLGASRLEKLLSCDIFKNVITDDEKNALVFSVQDNNEELFLKIADTIRGTDDDQSSFQVLNNEIIRNDHGSEHGTLLNIKADKDLYLSAVSAIISGALLFSGLYLSSILLFFLSLFILFSFFIKQKKNKEKSSKEKTLEQSRQRSSILFSDNITVSDKENIKSTVPSTDKTDNEVQHFKPLVTGKLTLIGDYKGINQEYSVYLDETYIGSDCFLSDIVLDDPLVSPRHAVIRQENGAFYLEPAKGTGKTYLEDSPVENGKRYEIKSGQKITIGDIEFRFGTEKLNKTEY